MDKIRKFFLRNLTRKDISNLSKGILNFTEAGDHTIFVQVFLYIALNKPEK